MIGQTISHYRIVEKFGGGGMGVVYKAEDTDLGRFVALKFLPDELAQDPQALERFRREARAASSLNHPNICTIHEIGQQDGHPFLVMEFLDGATLTHRIRGSPSRRTSCWLWRLRLPMHWMRPTPRGSFIATSSPQTFSSPSAVTPRFLISGWEKVALVSGSASRIASANAATVDNQHLTSPGSALGTVAYMSPEQVRAKELDARTDLFSFGVVLYEMATGMLPFRGESSGVIFESILNRAPVPPVRLNPDLPPDLERIINKCLEKDRNLRYQHASEIRADLQRLKRDTDSGKSAAVTEAAPDSRKRRLQWIAAGAVGVIAAIGIALFLWQSRHPQALRLDSVSSKAIAVLRFQNAGSDKDTDFLRLALPDEIANTLSYVQSFSIRPFATTSKYNGPNLDLQQAGREMRVTFIVT
jgi:eukaryotic-like serine/threonine-protein kinase